MTPLRASKVATAILCGAVAGIALLGGCGGSDGKVAPNEAKIPPLLQKYAVAQTAYRRKDFDKDQTLEYAEKLPALVQDLNGIAKRNGKKPYLPDALGAAHGQKGKPLHGYLFKECAALKSDTGIEQKFDWVNDYALCATPARYGQTGRRTFIINTNGKVWCKDLGKSELLSDYPMSPKAQGWQEAK